MARVDLLVPQHYVDYLKFRKDSSLSGHIRSAIAQYIHRLMQEETRLASASQSQRKESKNDE